MDLNRSNDGLEVLRLKSSKRISDTFIERSSNLHEKI